MGSIVKGLQERLKNRFLELRNTIHNLPSFKTTLEKRLVADSPAPCN